MELRNHTTLVPAILVPVLTALLLACSTPPAEEPQVPGVDPPAAAGAGAGSGGSAQAGSGGGPSGTPCAAPPVDLPTDITVTMDGRMHTLGEFKHAQLMPRKVHVFLPENYDTAERYPVVYAFDGLSFARATSMELDKQIAAGKAVAPHIVVGIESTSDRVNELAPWVQEAEPPSPEIQRGQGGKGIYLSELLVQVIKPYIDANYSTSCDRENTAVLGWSLGGLMCMYEMLTQPEVFGRGHCISASYWWNDYQIVEEWRNYQGPVPVRLWIDVGGAEVFDLMVNSARQMRDIAIARGMTLGGNLGYLEQPGGDHGGGIARLPAALWSISDLNATLLAEANATGLELSATSAAMSMASGPTTSHVAVKRSYAGDYQMTLPNAQVTLSSDTPAVATVDANGLITALSAGNARITATLGAASAGVDISVQP